MRKDIKWKYVNGKTDSTKIANVEDILHIKFPNDYIDCIRENSGGYPYPFNIVKNSKIPSGKGQFLALIDLNPESDGNILETYHNLNVHSGGDNQVPDGIIPFAFSHNDYYCFDFRNGFPPKVCFLDLEKHWDFVFNDKSHGDEIKEEDYLIHVCNSFTELLDMLEEEPKDE
ncbi:MAG: SMI1/KNR4 family protein [Methanoregula sp.]|nr:SMI1/KNR4 family protein [Methanoregula sp.]